MLNIDMERCTGCEVCANVCKRNAIKMAASDRGFLYPTINESLYVHCGQCEERCPLNMEVSPLKFKQRVWAAWSKDKNILLSSSSGGVFVHIAKEVLRRAGVICATRFEDDFLGVCFDICDNEKELPKFCGSKYIQSSPGMIYQRVKKHLKDKQLVLFVGRGCQVAGLKSYLGKSYENLLCVNLVCHGVPSPMVWKYYIEDLINKYGGKNIVASSFSKKKPSWKEYSIHIDFAHGKNMKPRKWKIHMRVSPKLCVNAQIGVRRKVKRGGEQGIYP